MQNIENQNSLGMPCACLKNLVFYLVLIHTISSSCAVFISFRTLSTKSSLCLSRNYKVSKSVVNH